MTYKSKWMIAVPVLATALFGAAPAIAQGVVQPVKVVNSSGQPVPTAAQGTTTVAGTVNVGNTPSVNVTNTPSVDIANTPTVTLSSGASVNVVNPPDGQNNPTPLGVLEATQPYGDYCSIGFGGGTYATCNFRAIPQGKQLVLQEFDASGNVEPGNRPVYVLLDGSLSTQNAFPYTFLLNDGTFDWLATHQETRLYFPPGTTPQCAVRLPQSSSGAYLCDFSGFLVDVSQADQGTTVRHQFPHLPPGFRPVPGR